MEVDSISTFVEKIIPKMKLSRCKQPIIGKNRNQSILEEIFFYFKINNKHLKITVNVCCRSIWQLRRKYCSIVTIWAEDYSNNSNSNNSNNNNNNNNHSSVHQIWVVLNSSCRNSLCSSWPAHLLQLGSIHRIQI